MADLPTVSDSNPIAGQAITLEVTVRNQGPGESGPTTLRYYRSTDSTVTPDDTQVGSVPVPGLNASASTVESIITDAPSVPGTHHYGACIDPVSLESDTTNNCSPTVAVTAAEPGFTLSGTVRDGRRNGLLLADATVRLENGQPQTTTTDLSGAYRFPNVSGTVTVRATAPYYVAEAVEVEMDADRTVDFALNTRGIVPYSGTVFITPDIIGPADPTSLQSVTYIGRGERTIFDRRPATWIKVNAYLFSVRYENAELEFQVNPEFGSIEAARAEVDTYAAALGRLPAVLLSRAQKVHVNAGHELFGGNWSDRSFLIHTGQGQEYIRTGFLEEVFFHEGGHTSLDGAHKDSAEWRAAQAADGVFISEYAQDFPNREDIAESILPYFAVRYFPERLTDADRALILATIPNRLAYFDEQGFDMSPYVLPENDSPFAAEPGFTLSGTVRDGRRNGLLLAGATVRLENGQPQTTTTDLSGAYRFPNVSGTVTVRATAPYYVAEAVEVAVDADRTVDFALNTRGIVPYYGTELSWPDLIGPADPTSLQSVTYIGRGERRIFDRRPFEWITVNAYLFSVRYENAELEFQINPEFGSREAARVEVDTYAPALGRLPAVLLSRAQKVHVNAGHELFGGNWGDRSFLIHTGQGQDYIRDGILEEIFVHEAAHVSLDGAHKDSAEWRAAQAADGVFISEYAQDFPDREDIAESILPYFAVRYFPERLTDADRALILATIPNRLAYFDEQGFDMSPYVLPENGSPFPQVVDVSVLEETFIISGLVSGPDGKLLEGIVIWAWQGRRKTAGLPKPERMVSLI